MDSMTRGTDIMTVLALPTWSLGAIGIPSLNVLVPERVTARTGHLLGMLIPSHVEISGTANAAVPVEGRQRKPQ